MCGVGAAAWHPALCHAGRRRGATVDCATVRVGARASAVRLSFHGGHFATRRLEGESQTSVSTVATGGLSGAEETAEKAAFGQREGGCHRRRAEHPDHVWAWDFVFDRTVNGRSLKWLSIVDEYTRECLALEVDRGMTSEDVLDVLRDLFVIRGVPKYIRSDNGPEFIAQAIRQFLSSAGVGTLYIEPGSPWQNGYAESFHSRLRSELLDAEIFETCARPRR